MSARENRYRLLLELYPADFRREYADEMIGVLMADPGPVRKHAASLVAGAVAARFRLTFDGPQWRRAAFAVQLFGSILLCAVALRRFEMNGAIAFVERRADMPSLDVYDLVRVVAWAGVLVATLTGLRVLSAAAALAGLIAEVAAGSRAYGDAPVTFLNVFWIVLSAALVLIASTVSARGPRPRGWLFVVAAGLVLAANGLVTRVYPGYFGALSFFQDNGPGYGITFLYLLMGGLLALIGVLRLEPALRRRVVACVVPVAAVFPLVGYGFGGFLDFNMRHPDDIQLLGPVQWAALILVPAAAFWVAAGLNVRLERSRALAAAAGGVTAERGMPVSADGAPDM
ncbi:MAG TPA: hypothetical protein VGD29_14675 [Actinoplanes sp.]|jgi:hypothetical protein